MRSPPLLTHSHQVIIPSHSLSRIAVHAPSSHTIAQWDTFEATFEGPDVSQPFLEVELRVVFSHGARELRATGFYDGDSLWRVRFMPDEPGEWHYRTECRHAALDGQVGRFVCTGPQPGVHGPVRVRNRYHFGYADGTPYLPFGTTCYAWTHQSLAMQQQTLQTLARTRFNKLRMGVFPKHYIYNENEPLMRMFELGSDGGEDFDRPNVEAFRHFEKQVLALMALGVEADVIVFHPYDRWGYCSMSFDQDCRYLKYLVARLSGYRNVWWSLANEYDFLIDVKPMHQWDRYFQVIQENAPHAPLMSIHNGDVNDNYDHHKPWVSHVCIQNWDVKRMPEWRAEWGKPVINDEPEYEGNIVKTWGNLSAQELVHRYWIMLCRGGYAGHGETYFDEDENLWWAKGGVLRGQAWQRIGWLRDLLEQDLREGLTPMPELKWPGPWARVSGAMERQGDYRLIYFGEHQPWEWANGLPLEDGDWELDLIDTWAMTITPLQRAPLPAAPALRQRNGAMGGGKPEAAFGVRLPGRTGLALRVRRRGA